MTRASRFIKLLFTAQLIISSTAASAQEQQVVDSLNRLLLKPLHDTVKVEIYIDLSMQYYLSAPSKAFDYCEQARKISEASGFKKGLATAYGFEAYLYEQKGEVAKAMELYKKSLVLAEETGNKKEASNILNNIAAIYNDQGKNEEALAWHSKSLKIREEIGYKSGISTSLNNIGYIYHHQGKIHEAIDYYSKSLKIYEAENDRDGIATTLQNMAGVYQDQGQTDEAMNYLNRALDIRKALRDSFGMSSSYNNIGHLFEIINKPLNAMDNYRKALLVSSAVDDQEGIAYASKNIGILFEKLANPDSSHYYLESAANKFTVLEDKWGLAIVLNKIGNIRHEKGDVKGAEKDLLKSFAYATELGYPVEIRNAAASLSVLYRKQGKWDQAIAMNDLYHQMRDSVLNDATRKASMQRQFQYEYDKKESALKAEQEKTMALADAQLQKQRLLKNSFIAGAILLFLMVIVLMNRYRIKQKSEREIRSAFDKLSMTQQQLIQQEKLASLGQLTAGIAHEIQNPLNFVNNFSDLSADLVNELENAADEQEKSEILGDLKDNLQKITMHGKRADRIVKSMLMHSRVSEGKRTPTDINNLCEEAIGFSYAGMKSVIPGFTCTINRQFENNLPAVSVAMQDISRVLINLLNNAFYAAARKVNDSATTARESGVTVAETEEPVVSVSTLTDNEKIIIRIRDNGDGIPDHIKEKIFQPFFTTKPTNEGTGLGLSISNDIIIAHGGELKVESAVHSYTQFEIVLPIS